MAEAAAAIAALSLTANILQVFDFSTKFVNAARHIWTTGKKGKATVQSLDTLKAFASHLKGVSHHLILDENIDPNNPGDQGIVDVAKDAQKLAQEMLFSLEEIGLCSSMKRRHAVASAFKAAWKEDEIRTLEKRAAGVMNRLVLNLTLSLRTYTRQSVELQAKILRGLGFSESTLNLSYAHEQMPANSAFGDAITKYAAEKIDHGEDLQRLFASRVLLQVSTEAESLLDSPPGEAVCPKITTATRDSITQQILRGLRYRGMDDRADTIPEAHQKTFRWVFSSDNVPTHPRTGFRGWLESDRPLYWITGKAGSGKSTLMKFISDFNSSSSTDSSQKTPEARCLKYLRRWTNGQPLVMASFYFWAAGSRVQTSKEGLYRTLLLQILGARPDMMPLALPVRWEALCIMGKYATSLSFTEPELKQALLRLVRLLADTSRICLFIDGLDEFKGDPADIIELLTDMMKDNQGVVKLCVASRPWVAFEEAMKDRPHLRLEDLTLADIKTYVESKFFVDPNFAVLRSREMEFAGRLLDNVVHRASGVFLWVRFVVASLLEGMHHGDRVKDLQQRLDALPSDLEDLYERILDDLDEMYRDHAAQYFGLMEASPGPPSVTLLSLADEENVDLAIDLPPCSVWSGSEVEQRTDTMRRRLNSRCKGLIEISREIPEGVRANTSLRRPIVQYLHKSVKDFLRQPSSKRRLEDGLRAPFDPDLRLCAANLAMLKIEMSSLQQPLASNAESLCGRIMGCLYHASRVSSEFYPEMIRLVDELHRVFIVTGAQYAPAAFQSECITVLGERNIILAFSDAEELTSASHWVGLYGHCFLDMAVRQGVVEFVKARARNGCLGPHIRLGKVGNDRISYPEETDDTGTKERRRQRLLPRQWISFFSRIPNTKSTTNQAWPLLLGATLSESLSTKMEMVTELFKKDANPNYAIRDGVTVWNLTLAAILMVLACAKSRGGERCRSWLDIAEVMITHGARCSRKAIRAAVERFNHMVSERSLHETGVSDAERKGLVEDLEREFLSFKRDGKSIRLNFVPRLSFRNIPLGSLRSHVLETFGAPGQSMFVDELDGAPIGSFGLESHNIIAGRSRSASVITLHSSVPVE